MSAQIDTQPSYSWYCPDCNDGSDYSSDLEQIEDDAAIHDLHHHEGEVAL